jgi:DNA-binding CsgD family transcriptional regulator
MRGGGDGVVRVKRPPTASESVRPGLVGRASELSRLEDEFERSTTDGACCVLVIGEPGLGKTRLCAEFAARQRKTALVLNARGYPLGATDALGLWSEALDEPLGRLSHDELVAVCGGFLGDLAVLLHSVAAARQSDQGEYSRRRLLDGLAVVLRNLGADRAVVAILDDVHLADAASLEALGYLVRNLTGTPLLVVATARPTELVEHPIAREVALSLEQDHLLSRMELTPLGPAALRDLAEAVIDGQPVPDALVDWLMDRSRGYPLFALGLLHAIVEEGADLAAPRLRHLPEGLRERVASHLSRLSGPALVTLELLAVVGRRIPVDDLIWLSARPLDDLGVILEELSAARLVTEHEEGAALAYEIAHPLVGEAVYERVGAARRRALHRRVARSLLTDGQLSAAAPHFARSARPGDTEAVDALCQAVRQAEERESYREAFAILEALLELLPEGDPRWLEVLDAMVVTPEWLPDHRADVGPLTGIRALKRIDTVLRKHPDRVKRARVLFRLATLQAWGAGAFDEALDSERRAIALFADAGLAVPACLAQVELAWILCLRGEWDAGLRQFRNVLAVAKAAGDITAEIWALQGVGSALTTGGALPEARDALRSAAGLAEQHQRSAAAARGRVLLARSLERAGLLDDADAALEQAAGWGSAVYEETIFYEAAANLAWLRGDLSAVLRAARELTARYPGGLSLRRAWGLAIAARAAAEMCRSDEARDLLARAEDVYGDRQFLSFSEHCTWADGALQWIRGSVDNAVVRLQDAADRFEANDLAVCPHVLVDICEAAAGAGQVAVTAQAAERLDGLATRLSTEVASGLAGLGNAWHLLAARKHEDAAGTAEEAGRLLGDTGHALLAGRAYEVRGRALLASDRERARDVLEQAASVFDACQAAWRHDHVRRLLKRLGHRGRRAAASIGPAALSAREREVVELAVHGYTAREIAARLFIGKRTVETHLANAYVKLGVTSRRQLRDKARHLGI